MVARIVTFQLQPGKLDELVHLAANAVLPLMQQQAGCKLITILTDQVANKALAVGLWESAADLQANEQNGMYQEQLTQVSHLLAAPPLREVYEVSVQTAPI
jgi:quinol monooxygenase YgiN